MADIEERIAALEAARAAAGKPSLTRAEVRAALTCPVCKTPGALLADKCGKCGSYQNDAGQWVTPDEPGEKRGGSGWFW